ncbi:hypothetical protein BH11BAC3_BH11BAC3_13310 [soil metagenome]
MEDFTITTRTTTKEYAKVMLIGLYKKTGFIIATIVGLYLLTTVILNYFNIINYYSDTPYFEFFCGLFVLLGPALITFIAVRQFNSNPSFQHTIKYTFSDNGMVIEGKTFKGEFLWAHIIKQKEISSFIILYHSKKTGNFIDKTKLTKEQLQFIKTKVGQN